MHHYNSQWFFCFLSLPKTFVLMGSFCSRKVTHKPSINIAWRLNIKTLKFDTVYSIDKIWKSLKFLFLHIFSRMLYIKSIIRFELLQLNHIKQSPKKANTIFLLEFVGNFRGCVEHMFCYLIYNNCSLIKKFIHKNGLPSSKKVAFICFNKKLFKNDEKCVLVPVKMSLFVLQIFKFLSWLFWLCKKWLDEKTKVSKFMTSQTGILTITVRILSNFSWSESSQTMKFILFIEYKMRKIFLRKLVLIPFIKIKIDHIAGSIFWNVISFAVMICPSRVPSVPHMTLFFFL